MKKMFLVFLCIAKIGFAATDKIENTLLYKHFHDHLYSSLHLFKLKKDGRVSFQINKNDSIINLRINIPKRDKGYALLKRAFIKMPLHLIAPNNVDIKNTYEIIVLKKGTNGATIINKSIKFDYYRPPTLKNCQKIDTYHQITKCIDVNLKHKIAKNFIANHQWIPSLPKKTYVSILIDSSGVISNVSSNIKNPKVKNILNSTLNQLKLPIIAPSSHRHYKHKFNFYSSLIKTGKYIYPAYDDLNKNNRLLFDNPVSSHFKKHLNFDTITIKTSDTTNYLEVKFKIEQQKYIVDGYDYNCIDDKENNDKLTTKRSPQNSFFNNTYKKLKKTLKLLPYNSIPVDTLNPNFRYYMKFLNNFNEDITVLNCNLEINYKSPVYLNNKKVSKIVLIQKLQKELSKFISKHIPKHLDSTRIKIYITVEPTGQLKILDIKPDSDINKTLLENYLNNGQFNIKYTFSKNFKPLFFSIRATIN